MTGWNRTDDYHTGGLVQPAVALAPLIRAVVWQRTGGTRPTWNVTVYRSPWPRRDVLVPLRPLAVGATIEGPDRVFTDRDLALDYAQQRVWAMRIAEAVASAGVSSAELLDGLSERVAAVLGITPDPMEAP